MIKSSGVKVIKKSKNQYVQNKRKKINEKQNKIFEFAKDTNNTIPCYMICNNYSNGLIIFILNSDGLILKVYGTNNGHYDIKNLTVIKFDKIKNLIFEYITNINKIYINYLPTNINLCNYTDKIYIFKCNIEYLLKNFKFIMHNMLNKVICNETIIEIIKAKQQEEIILNKQLKKNTINEDLIKLFQELDSSLTRIDCIKILEEK